MIFRFAKCDAGALFEMAHHFAGKSRCRLSPVPTAVPPSASSCNAAIACSARRFSETHLLRVTAELLAEPDRRRVHQMGATDLDDVVKLCRFRGQRVAPVFRARE